MQRFTKPHRFKDFKIMFAPIQNRPDINRIYDIGNKTIWVNTTANDKANVTGFKPEGW